MSPVHEPPSPARKLGITDDSVFTVRHAPAGFAALLGDTGDAVWQQSLLAPLDIVVAFHTSRTALVAEWPKLTAAAQPAGVVWIAWPRRDSGVASDLSEDVLRAELLPTGWVDTKACNLEDTWTALRFTMRHEPRRPRDNARRRR